MKAQELLELLQALDAEDLDKEVVIFDSDFMSLDKSYLNFVNVGKEANLYYRPDETSEQETVLYIGDPELI